MCHLPGSALSPGAVALPLLFPGSVCHCWSRRDLVVGGPAIASHTRAQEIFVKVGRTVGKTFILPTPQTHLHLCVYSTCY